MPAAISLSGMENRRNYYRILHVQPGAPVEIIRASYRTLMQRLKAHPDLGGDHWNAAIINEAYAVLTNAEKRADYDRDFQARVLDARSAAEGRAATSTAATDHPATGTKVGSCVFCRTPYPAMPRLHADAACATCGSPLRRVTALQIADAGSRSVPRLPRAHRLQLYTSWPQARGIPAESRDLSPNGLSFATMELLRPSAIVKLDSPLFRAVVQIRNTRIEDNGASGLWIMGAEFLTVLFAHSRGAFLTASA
jgi:curved DNA-binding protein CbpA